MDKNYKNTFKKLFEEGVKVKNDCDFFQPFELAPLPVAVPASYPWTNIKGCTADMTIIDDVIKEEGKTPMRNYNDAYASASVTTPKSDTAVQRDYLLARLDSALYPKQKELQELFHLNVNNSPKSYKELIDIIKKGNYTIDAKIAKRFEMSEMEGAEEDCALVYHGPLYGIVWPGPVADWKGYRNAEATLDDLSVKVKDTIMGGVYADGLKALQDFEAWLPTSAAIAS